MNRRGPGTFTGSTKFQPDLNTSNPEVQAEILRIMGFWIQLGVSGFRMDAVPFIIATKGADVLEPEEQYDMLRMFREFLQWRQGDCIALAEANVLPETDLEYFGRDGDRMHMMFNFQVNQNLFYALASADTRPLVKALKATEPRPATAQWGIFLRNHDELDLGRLTEEQRQTVFAAFGPDSDMQLYQRGIRRRRAGDPPRRAARGRPALPDHRAGARLGPDQPAAGDGRSPVLPAKFRDAAVSAPISTTSASACR